MAPNGKIAGKDQPGWKLPYYITVACMHQDEGARNIQRRDQNNVILGGVMENYPIDTFVVVLNHHLNAGIAVDEGEK